MKKIIVVGTTHDEQRASNIGTVLEKRLDYITKNHATIIIEEWTYGDFSTIGSRIAEAKSLEWCNAGTPLDEEFETFLPQPLWIDGDCLTHHPYGPMSAQIKREAYMIKEIMRSMTDHKTGIFICGMAHLHSICEKLYLAGFNVEGFSVF
jgi:hypothetical protein